MADSENKPVSGNREKMLSRLKTKYPDQNFEDDEALMGRISDDYDDYDNQINGYKDRENTFSDMFTSDPRSASFMTNWRKGEDPAVQLVRQFGTEIKEAIDDPARQEEIAAANKEYVDRVAQEKTLDEEYKKNLAESLSYLEEFQKKNGLSDDDIDNAMELLVNIVKDGIMGKFTPQSIDMAMKAINHDADVNQASMEGEIKGKNKKVSEVLRHNEQGDGMPHIEGQNGNQPKMERRGKSIFDWAKEAK